LAPAPESPQDVVIGVVGDGFSALDVYATSVYLGFRPEQIGIFGEQTNPVHTYQQYAWNLGQTILRSESESHFMPADWPTFSQLNAYARRDPRPLFRSAERKFNPGVPEILAQAEVVRTMLGYNERVLGGRKVGWVVREPGPPPHFALYDEGAALIGRCKHAMIAVGHGPLSFPGVYGKARHDPATAERVLQAYEPKQYHSGARYIVIGSGIASTNEWVNAVEAGASCIALRRNPHPDEQDLNVPRCLFDGSGIDAFEALSFKERLDFLEVVLRGTTPMRSTWVHELRQAEQEGRFEEIIGEITEIEPGPAGLRVVRLLEAAQQSIKNSVLGQFPIIGTQIQVQALHGRAAALVIGLITSLLGGLGVTQAARNAFDRVWAVPFKHRPDFLRSRLRGLMLLGSLGVLFILATAASGLS